jgi:hypothetical protein
MSSTQVDSDSQVNSNRNYHRNKPGERGRTEPGRKFFLELEGGMKREFAELKQTVYQKNKNISLTES